MSQIRCLRCGEAMLQVSCKVRCPRCQLFYDCSDGMLPMPEGEKLLEVIRAAQPGTTLTSPDRPRSASA